MTRLTESCYQQSAHLKFSCSVMSNSLRPRGCQPPLSMGLPSKNTGVGSHFLLQGIFPTQRLNPHLLHCRQILYHLSYQGSLLLEFKDTAFCYNRVPQILITHQASVFAASHEAQLSIFLQSLWPGLTAKIPISLSTSCSLRINSLLVKITK